MLPNEFPNVFHQLGFVSKKSNCTPVSGYPREREKEYKRESETEGDMQKDGDSERNCSREETGRLESTSVINGS